MFVYNGSQWQLAGINYGVDGLFDFDANIDDNEFGAALYDMGGLYLGNDAQGWTLTQDLAEDVASTLYVSRISEHAAAIQSIVGVPEPGTGVLLVLALTLSMRRGRKRPN